MAKNSFRKGQDVQCSWGKGTAKGKVTGRFERKVQRTLKGTKVRKNGTEDNPAYLIEQEDGDKVLKRGSELEAAG